MTRQELTDYIFNTYSVEPDHPFPRDEESCVFRHRSNRKWFALTMSIPYRTLGISRDGKVDVLNIKCDPAMIGPLRGKPGFCPAYHMNKDKWITVLLDGSAEREDIVGLLAFSYEMTAAKHIGKRNSTPDLPVKIEKVKKDSKRAEELLRFVENCSWTEARDHIARNIREWGFTDWEAMFAAVLDGKIVGMASVMKTDYYPMPEVFPWVSSLFVSEEYRGHRISGELIACANRYLKGLDFERSYIPSEFSGLYEHYGYRYLRDIVNYGGGTDRLYVKELEA